MSEFGTYLKVGFQHISDWAAYDHMLFLLALTAIYQLYQWKDILILVTAFTIGHSISLAVATLGLINMGASLGSAENPIQLSQIIEFLIPLTILATAMLNVVKREGAKYKEVMRRQYLLALGFGLIHGLGFSNLLRTMLGGEESLFIPLLGFNLGLEIGQIFIVTVIVALSAFVVKVLRAPHKEWNLFVSGAAAGVAWILLMETKFW